MSAADVVIDSWGKESLRIFHCLYPELRVCTKQRKREMVKMLFAAKLAPSKQSGKVVSFAIVTGSSAVNGKVSREIA